MYTCVAKKLHFAKSLSVCIVPDLENANKILVRKKSLQRPTHSGNATNGLDFGVWDGAFVMM
jgi:hypothetical protein